LREKVRPPAMAVCQLRRCFAALGCQGLPPRPSVHAVGHSFQVPATPGNFSLTAICIGGRLRAPTRVHFSPAKALAGRPSRVSAFLQLEEFRRITLTVIFFRHVALGHGWRDLRPCCGPGAGFRLLGPHQFDLSVRSFPCAGDAPQPGPWPRPVGAPLRCPTLAPPPTKTPRQTSPANH